MTASLGEDAQCFRGTITIAGRKPIRHLVAISVELAKTRPGADPEGRRTILCDSDPMFVLYRISQRFGLPVVPEWAAWFNEELNRRAAIKPLIGLGCSPVLVSGTKKLFLKWIRRALRQKRIEVPDRMGRSAGASSMVSSESARLTCRRRVTRRPAKRVPPREFDPRSCCASPAKDRHTSRATSTRISVRPIIRNSYFEVRVPLRRGACVWVLLFLCWTAGFSGAGSGRSEL